jgi:hypothetical protein
MMTSEQQDKMEHARRCALGTMASIREMVEAMRAAEASDDGEAELEGDRLDSDGIRERMLESPLELTIRGFRNHLNAWEADRYELLMGTGGPAVRIVGDLNGGEASTAEMECQDWFTPWTPVPLEPEDCEALQAFVGQFYMGD